MKTLLRAILALSAVIIAMPFAANAAELSKGEKDTIFIGALKVQPSVVELAEKNGRQSELKRIINSLETQFIASLNATRVFQLVERSRKGDIELEQGFAAVAVDPNDKNAAQAGKMAGAKYAFLPQIDGFEDSSQTTEYQAIGQASMSRKLFLSALVQIVDTTTGKLLPDSPSIQLNKTDEIENVRMGQVNSSDQVIVMLAKEMAGKLSQEIVSFLRPAKVLSVSGNTIMFNRGTEAGFKSGDMVEFYAIENVKDEDTGETFRNEVPVGQGTINRIDKNQSYAKVTGDNMGITKGCVVRGIKAPPSQPSDSENALKATMPEFSKKKESGMTPGSSEAPLNWK